MATIRKRGNSWQAQVARVGVRMSATFETKAKANAWAIEQEADLQSGKRGSIPSNKTFGDLLKRYRDEVSINKRGGKWESDRINAVLRDDPIADVKLLKFDATEAAKWRDRRLKVVSASTVLREWNLHSHACNIARREWKWLNDNPFKDVARPAPPPPRDRRFTQDEIDRLLLAFGCDPQATPTTMTARVGFVMLFAIETAMRAGEIVGLRWPDITDNVARLAMTKNGSARVVPLSIEALRLLGQLPRTEDVDSIFQIDSKSLDVLFRKGRDRALIEDLHFHDTRREALTRLSSKVDVMTLAKISGHRDLRILQNTSPPPSVIIRLFVCREITNLNPVYFVQDHRVAGDFFVESPCARSRSPG